MAVKHSPGKKTIIFYSHSPVVGGVLRHVEALAMELVHRGFDVLVALNPAPEIDDFAMRLSLAGVRVERSVAGGWKDVRRILDWWNVLRRERPQVVHFHQCAIHENALAILLAACRRLSIVLTEHMPFGADPAGLLRRAGKRLLLALARAVILLGPSHVAPYARLTGAGLGKLRVLPPFSIAVSHVERSWQGMVGFIGEFSENKGFRHLAAMAPFLVMNGYRLKAFGRGPLAVLLQEQAASLGAAVEVSSFAGDPRQALEQIDVLLVLSAHEGLPLVILEAISAGIPVLTTRVGVISDYFADGEGLLFLDSTDGSAVLAGLEPLRQDDKRQKLIALGQERWQREFTPALVIEKWINLYREVGRE